MRLKNKLVELTEHRRKKEDKTREQEKDQEKLFKPKHRKKD